MGGNFYIGIISNITGEKESRKVFITIPDVVENAIAYPKSGDMDEPKTGDPILVLDMDPVFHSYYIYEKLKETDFIGFRASGKMISVTPDYIKIAVYDKDAEFNESSEPDEKSMKTVVTIDNDGNVSIESSGTVGIYGLNGETASLTTGNTAKPGTVNPNPLGGGFCNSTIKNCPYMGFSHVGNKITGIGGKSII